MSRVNRAIVRAINALTLPARPARDPSLAGQLSALLLDRRQPDRKLSRHLLQIAFATEIPMDALDSVLADLVDTDRDCTYATIKREPLEALIYEWARRRDQLTLLSGLLMRARNQLAQDHPSDSSDASRESTLRALDSAVTESASALARHRHAVRRELAARLKQVLRSAIAEVGTHATDALLAGNRELAERLESERRTVRIVMSTIDTVVNRVLQDELIAAEQRRGEGRHAAPPA